MHLGIIEFCEKNHHSMIYNWTQVAKINDWKITLFTTKDIYDNVKNELDDLNHNVIIQDTNNFIFFKEIIKKYKILKIDKLLFLSVTCRFLPFLYVNLKNIDYGITIHNSNVWFEGNVIRKVSHVIKRLVRYRLKREASFFVVNSLNMKNYIESNFNESRPISVMPFSLKRSFLDKNKSNIFTVVYPGGIDINRKKYESFIKLAIDNANDKFIVLGTCSKNKESLAIFTRMKSIQNIELYDEYISVKEFNSVLNKADLLFSEIMVDFNLSDMSEKYGLTKDTGISYIMIEFMLPCLLNKEFVNLKELSSSSVYFRNYEGLQKKYDQFRNTEIDKTILNSMQKDLSDFNITDFAKSIQIEWKI